MLPRSAAIPIDCAGNTPPNTPLPNPVQVLGKIEAMLSAGVNIVQLGTVTGLGEAVLNTLLSASNRKSLGQTKEGYEIGREADPLRKLDAWLTTNPNFGGGMFPHADMPTGRRIEAVVNRALAKKSNEVIVSPWGVGKSWELKRLAKAEPMTRTRPGILFVPFTRDDSNPAAVYRKIPARCCQEQQSDLLPYQAWACFRCSVGVLDVRQPQQQARQDGLLGEWRPASLQPRLVLRHWV